MSSTIERRIRRTSFTFLFVMYMARIAVASMRAFEIKKELLLQERDSQDMSETTEALQTEAATVKVNIVKDALDLPLSFSLMCRGNFGGRTSEAIICMCSLAASLVSLWCLLPPRTQDHPSISAGTQEKNTTK